MSDIKVYGTARCPDCRRSKRYLDDEGIAYDWTDIEADPAAMRRVWRLRNAARRTHAIVFPDGSILVEPTDPELAAKLGLALAARV